jgi:hypothetical protein
MASATGGVKPTAHARLVQVVREEANTRMAGDYRIRRVFPWQRTPEDGSVTLDVKRDGPPDGTALGKC